MLCNPGPGVPQAGQDRYEPSPETQPLSLIHI